MLFIIWSVVLVAAVILYLCQVYSKLHRQGVKHDRIVPVLGNMSSLLLRKEHFVDVLSNAYNNYREERFVGRYEFMKPMLIIRDLDLIKKITIKDFEHFLDHRVYVNKNMDPLLFRHLFALSGQEWKDMRSTLSPAFTSSKIRLMVPFMVEVGDQMVLSLKNQIQDSDSAYLDIEVKDLTTRYANDVIASCAFGLKVNSHIDKNNEFYSQGILISSYNIKMIIQFLITTVAPWLAKILGIRPIFESTMNFFRNIVLDTMKHREENNVIRPDMIHLLMEAKKGQLSNDEKSDTDAGFAAVEESTVGKKDIDRVWTNDDLIAQALIFFVAGFETVSSAMVFLLYELAVNPDVQDKLYQEIKEKDAKNKREFDYKSIQEMTYMDMVVSEVLRLWPPAIGLDRLCIKDYNLGKPNERATEDFIITKGMGVQIPTWAIHRDPQYYPNPNKFNPDRFSEDNKHTIHPFAYIPFGLGPRNCIGSRFALCEIKVMVYQLLRHMEVSPGPKTRIPVELDKETVNLKMKGGHWLRFRARN